MNCKYCNNELTNSDAKFCNKCGKPIAKEITDRKKLVLPICILLGCVILGGFYYASQRSKQNSIEQQQIINRELTKKTKCIDLIQKQEEEIKKLTTYSPFVEDRGCFLEAGCMQGVKDENYKAKFETCNNDYYNECLDGVKAEANKRFNAEKQRRILECMNLY